MRRFGALGGALLSLALACSGESKSKSNHAATAGTGGASEAGAASGGAGNGGSAGQTLVLSGSSSGGASAGGQVNAGAAGVSASGAAAAGSAGALTAGGAGSGAGSGAGGSAGGASGGAGGACPAQTTTFNYDCAEVESKWKPKWDDAKGEIQFDVSSLPFPIKSGTLFFFYQERGVGCALLQAHGTGTLAVVPVGVPFAPSALRVAEFHFVDTCGNHHDYDPGTPAACNDLRGTGKGGVWPLACNTRQDAKCPETCNL